MRKPRCAAMGLALGMLACGSAALAKTARPDAAAAKESDVSTPPALAVSFAVQPEVGEQPPVLAVTLRNPSKQPIKYTRVEGARCFVDFLLTLDIKRADGKPVPISPCVVKAGVPMIAASLAPGRSERFLVPFAELANPWPLGTYSIEVDWKTERLEQAQASAPRAMQTSLNTSTFTIARPLTKLRVKRGETVKLPDGVRFTFAGHSHKDVGPGDTSPLMISGSIKTTAGDEEFSVNLQTEQTRLLRLADDRVFELVDYAYDAWMELRYYGRIVWPSP